MSEPVDWRADGTPFSPRFQDHFRSHDGGLSQARDVFVAGCGLPVAWRGAARWCVLETGFGLGLNFLCTWQAWRNDPLRPPQLHYVGTETWPGSAEDIRRHASVDPDLVPLAEELAQRWWGLEPGTHRIALDGGRVLLTLLVGDSAASLRGLGRFADSVYLDGFSPERNPDIWSSDTLRAVARCCRRAARLVSCTAAAAIHDGLTSAGFLVEKVEGAPPSGDTIRARLVHLPSRHVDAPLLVPTRCTVVGAGLAGAAVARGLALRGWQVTVLEAGTGPAAGASGVPAGLFAPHVSADDAVLSRLTRAGVRALLNVVPGLLRRGTDWDLSGVWQRQDDASLTHHETAGWLRPARLVSALLATPGVAVEYGRRVDEITGLSDPLVIVAAGFETVQLLAPGFPLQAVAGQVAFGPVEGEPATPAPFNGHGHFLPALPAGYGHFWLAGASFERDVSTIKIPDDDLARHRADNRQRLGELLPTLVPRLPAMFASASDWRGVRATSPDRLPVVGPWPTGDKSAWICTALGARGITLALLCADLLVARLHGEPLPVAPRLADAVFTERVRKRLER